MNKKIIKFDGIEIEEYKFHLQIFIRSMETDEKGCITDKHRNTNTRIILID